MFHFVIFSEPETASSKRSIRRILTRPRRSVERQHSGRCLTTPKVRASVRGCVSVWPPHHTSVHPHSQSQYIVHPGFSRVLKLRALTSLRTALQGGRLRRLTPASKKNTPRKWQRRWSTDSLGFGNNAWSDRSLDYIANLFPCLFDIPLTSDLRIDTTAAGKMFSATMAGKVLDLCSLSSLNLFNDLAWWM